MNLKEFLENKGFIKEGRFVKDANNKVVNGLIKGVLKKYIDAQDIKLKKLASENPEENDGSYGEGVSLVKIQELVEEYVSALQKHGPMSTGLTGTAFWIVKIMNELGMDTNKRTSLEKFEKEITVAAGKLMGKIK